MPKTIGFLGRCHPRRQTKRKQKKCFFFTYLAVYWVSEVLLRHADHRAGEQDEHGHLVVQPEHEVVDADVLWLEQVANARQEVQSHGRRRAFAVSAKKIPHPPYR